MRREGRGRGVFAKLVALILVLGASGGGLLAMRQSRLQSAHELAAARLRMREHEERLLRLRTEIIEETTPAAVGELVRVEGVGPLEPAIDHVAEFPVLVPGPEEAGWVDEGAWVGDE